MLSINCVFVTDSAHKLYLRITAPLYLPRLHIFLVGPIYYTKQPSWHKPHTLSGLETCIPSRLDSMKNEKNTIKSEYTVWPQNNKLSEETTTWMQKVVKFSQRMIDCNPRIDTLLLSRYDFYVSRWEQKIKLESQINTIASWSLL